MDNITKSISKATMKAKIEELQAKRRELLKIKPPKWLANPRLIAHALRTHEMVSLSRDSDFAKIPAELQLHIISKMDYPSVLKLKKSCRYFNFFINSTIIEESKAQQIARFKTMEQSRSRLPVGKVPCYSCLHLKSQSEFYDIGGKYYYGTDVVTTTYYPARRVVVEAPLQIFTRTCIRCNFRAGTYEPGLKLTTGGQEWMVCTACGMLGKERAVGVAVSHAYSKTTGICRPCSGGHEFVKGVGGLVRMLQCVLALVILPLACTGQAIPWTSKPDRNSVRWIFTIVIDLLTIGACFVSACFRLQKPSYNTTYSHKRTENHRLLFPVELAACLGWLGILAALFNEARQWRFSGRYDRFAKGLTALVFVEALLFILTNLWSNRVSRRLALPSTRVSRAVV